MMTSVLSSSAFRKIAVVCLTIGVAALILVVTTVVVFAQPALMSATEAHSAALMPMERYLVGGVLMGFGSMLAGGCAVGAGMSGGSIFALTAWLALFSMWVGASITQLAITIGHRRRNSSSFA
jgi:uncharacterized membrane protein YedE/YeeE